MLSTRRGGFGLLVLFFVSACGGVAREELGAGSASTGGTGANAGAGGNASGGTGSGGTASGGAGWGGTASGGTGWGGTGAGGTGMGGSGPGLPERCLLPKAPGMCTAYFPAYWHNPKTGVCEPFAYGGCGGNDNRFESLAVCQNACNGGTPNMDLCSAPGQCTLASPGCCGVCDNGTAHSFVAINRAFQVQYRDAIGCTGTACGACPDFTEFDRTSQNFIATCQESRCTVVDLRESGLTTCTVSADCVLRDGAECCEGCDGKGFVALHRNAQLRNLVCESSTTACPACLPPTPPGLLSVCQSGRCRVSTLP